MDAAEALRNTYAWFEVNSGWAQPDDDNLAEWVADGVCRCPDECIVAPDAWCEHGLASWWLIVQDLRDYSGGTSMNDLGRIWEWFADTSCKGYSPIYDRICRFVANDDDVLALAHEAPPAAHQPNVLLGVVHYLLLGGLDHPLAAVYAGESDADPGPLFRDLCLTHRTEVLELMETRRTQTNECGRSAVIGPALTWVAQQFGAPIALLDVGASAGLNLGCDRYLLDYGSAGTTGPADADGAHRLHGARR